MAAEPSPQLPLPDAVRAPGATVRRALDELAEHYEHVERKFDDAAWVGARLTELLPIELADKQALLELDDPIERLDALLTQPVAVPERRTRARNRVRPAVRCPYHAVQQRTRRSPGSSRAPSSR